MEFTAQNFASAFQEEVERFSNVQLARFLDMDRATVKRWREDLPASLPDWTTITTVLPHCGWSLEEILLLRNIYDQAQFLTPTRRRRKSRERTTEPMLPSVPPLNPPQSDAVLL